MNRKNSALARLHVWLLFLFICLLFYFLLFYYYFLAKYTFFLLKILKAPSLEEALTLRQGQKFNERSSLQCRRFVFDRAICSRKRHFPKWEGNGASQKERAGGGESYYFYSPQSSSVIKSKMAATTTLRTRTRFHPPKIRLHCRLWALRPLDRVNTVS